MLTAAKNYASRTLKLTHCTIEAYQLTHMDTADQM
jgi:hypothetical protein